MIIDKNKYFTFLKKVNKNCIFETYKELYLLKNINKYPSTNSNVQIKFLINEILKNKNITYLNYFLILLTNFIPFNNTFNLFEIIKNKDIKDTEVLSLVEKCRAKHLNTIYSIGQKCDKQTFGIEYLKKKIKKINIRFNNPNYLDIGCGNGKKTILFSKIFNIKNVYGTDINNWGPYKKNKDFPFNFKFILNDKLDYDDNSFDIITCFLTLHHIKNLDKIIIEIRRILKRDGIFILIEHDALNYYDKLLIEIQHTFFAFLYDKNKNYIKSPYYSNYLNNMEFQYIFTDKFNFKLIDSGVYYQTIDMQKRYDSQFYQIYKKNSF